MKYVVLVSHGTFAPGLHSVLKMLAGGEREDVISVGLEDGMSADEFAEKFSNAISKITEDDEIILLGDSLINEAKDAVKEFVMTSANDDEEDDI